MKKLVVMLVCLCCLATGVKAQENASDHRAVVAVSLKSSPEAQRFAPVVYNAVVEMLVKAHKFRVIDIENKDQIERELERQKDARFMETDPSQLADITQALAANKTMIVKVDKVPVYAMSTNGNTSGFKSAVAFQLLLTDVESGRSTESQSFQGKTSKEMLSAQAAVNEATNSVAPQVLEYLSQNFPLECSVVKLLESKGDAARLVLLDVGSDHGIRPGDTFTVSYVEMLNGKPLPTEIGTVKVKLLKGTDFCEAEVMGKNTGKELVSRFGNAQKLVCTQIVR